MTPSVLDTSWADQITLPPPGNMMEPGENGPGIFVRQGTRMSAALEDCIIKHVKTKEVKDLDILDFGCGVGRVTLPFYHKYQQPKIICDVDSVSLAYVRSVIPSITAIKTEYTPPTPFIDGSFDVIMAISVWTHLPPDLQIPWLLEIRRILRPGGVALISTSSYQALVGRRIKLTAWKSVTDDDLSREGFIFREAGATAGITGVYGYALHTAEYIRHNWSHVLDVIEIVEGGIEGVQDINILRRPK